VAIAVLWSEGRMLVRQRRSHEHLPGLWEFPGGKVEPNESPLETVRREIKEETALEAGELSLLSVFDHDYPGRTVTIHAFEGRVEGSAHAADGATLRWVTPDELTSLPIPRANRALVEDLARRHRPERT
jgi:mutator protein MutT